MNNNNNKNKKTEKEINTTLEGVVVVESTSPPKSNRLLDDININNALSTREDIFESNSGMLKNKTESLEINIHDSSFTIGSESDFIPTKVFDKYEFSLDKNNNKIVSLCHDDFNSKSIDVNTNYSTSQDNLNDKVNGLVNMKFVTTDNNNNINKLKLVLFEEDNTNNDVQYKSIEGGFEQKSSKTKSNFGHDIHSEFNIMNCDVEFNRFSVDNSYTIESIYGKKTTTTSETIQCSKKHDLVLDKNNLKIKKILDDSSSIVINVGNLIKSYNVDKYDFEGSSTIRTAGVNLVNIDGISYYLPDSLDEYDPTDNIDVGVNNKNKNSMEINEFSISYNKDLNSNLNLSSELILNSYCEESNESIYDLGTVESIYGLSLKQLRLVDTDLERVVDKTLNYNNTFNVSHFERKDLETVDKSMSENKYNKIEYNERVMIGDLYGTYNDLDLTVSLNNINRDYKLIGVNGINKEFYRNYSNNITLPKLNLDYNLNNFKINTKYYHSITENLELLNKNDNSNDIPITKYINFDTTLNSQFNLGSNTFDLKLNRYSKNTSNKAYETPDNTAAFDRKENILGSSLFLETSVPFNGTASTSVSQEKTNLSNDLNSVDSKELKVMGKFSISPLDKLNIRSSLIWNIKYNLQGDSSLRSDPTKFFDINLHSDYQLYDNINLYFQLNKPNYKKKSSSRTTEVTVPKIALGVTYKL